MQKIGKNRHLRSIKCRSTNEIGHADLFVDPALLIVLVIQSFYLYSFQDIRQQFKK